VRHKPVAVSCCLNLLKLDNHLRFAMSGQMRSLESLRSVF
jgi:hypothetical protein